MLLRWDPFRDLDRLAESAWRASDGGPARIPMDAVRTGDRVDIHFEVPGVDPDAIEVDVDRNVLTVAAERSATTERTEGDEVLVRERRHGRFVRQVTLGDDLDVEHLSARYHDGVLTVSVPVEAKGGSRRVEVARGAGPEAIDTPSREASSDAPSEGHTHAA